MALRTYERLVQPTPDAVVNAREALVNACKAWPTEAVTVDTSAPPVFSKAAQVIGDEGVICEVAMQDGGEAIGEVVEHTAVITAMGTLILACLVWASYKVVCSAWNGLQILIKHRKDSEQQSTSL